MKEIVQQHVQEILNDYTDKEVYIHVEITGGMYASHFNEEVFNASTFVRNVCVNIEKATIKEGDRGQYRIGLKLDNGGWVYVMGLTHYVINEDSELIIHGFNYEGKLASALQISTLPFRK